MNEKNEGEIEVPFELYQQWCRRCSDREETLTSDEEIMEQWTRFADQRNPVKIQCGAVNRCLRLKRKRKNDTSIVAEKEDGELLNY